MTKPKTKKITKAKKVVRQLRLTTTVSPVEKQRAEKIAKEEGFESVGDLVRALISERHKIRVKKAKAKRERAAKKKASLRHAPPSLAAKSRNPLPLRNPALAAKPTRTSSTRKRTSSSTASSTAKKALNGGVVATARNSRNPATGTTKLRAAANR